MFARHTAHQMNNDNPNSIQMNTKQIIAYPARFLAASMSASELETGLTLKVIQQHPQQKNIDNRR